MSPLAKEWLAKGLADLATAEREIRARKNPNYDAVCLPGALLLSPSMHARKLPST